MVCDCKRKRKRESYIIRNMFLVKKQRTNDQREGLTQG